MVLIVNPKAGKCKGVKQLGEITQTIRKQGCVPIVLLTSKAGDACRFAYDYGNEVDVVCCVGGDGTFSEVVAGMVSGKHSAPVGYIPAGSTNDYASSLGLSRNLHIAASNAVHGISQSFDIGMFNGYPFAYSAAFGMLAKVSYSTPQKLKNIVGRLAYFLEGIHDLHSLRAEAMTIDTDGEHIEGEYLFGAVSNTTSMGGVLHFDSGDVKLDDGYLELLLISKPSSPREFAQLVHALSTRSYSECSCIIYRKCKHVRIISQKRIPWTLDGEPAKESDHVDIEIIPQAIRVMITLNDAQIKDKKLRLVIVGSITIDCRNGEIDPMSAAFMKMAGVFSELELQMIRARVRSGVRNAQSKGVKVGRKPTTQDDIPAIFYKHYPAFVAKQMNVSELARICGLSRPTVYKYLRLL